MSINSSFSIYEPEAWVEVALSNEYPMRPMVSKAVTNVAGASVEGLVASRNKSVNITRADKPDGTNVKAYSGTYDAAREPSATEQTLTIDKHYYDVFKIDKSDQRFALPDLVQQHFIPALHSMIDQIQLDVKAEARSAFEVGFADIGTDATVIDDADLRRARQIMLERKLVSDNLMMVIDPTAENDLTGLDLFHQADQFGSRSTLLDGSLGRAFGFDFFVDNLGSDHTPAVVTDAVVAGAASVGDTSITIDDGAAGAATISLVEGDIIYFGSANGEDQFYTVDSQTASALVLKEPLRDAVADNATINPVDIAAADTGREQFFYDPSALSLVTAVMDGVDANSGSGVRRAAGFEPMNGVNYTLTVEETKAGADVLIEVLYGSKVFRPDLGGRYIRGNEAKA